MFLIKWNSQGKKLLTNVKPGDHQQNMYKQMMSHLPVHYYKKT